MNFWQAFEGEIGPPLDDAGQWGTITANGLGMVTGGSLTGNDAGTVIGPLPVPPIPYSISAGNHLSLTPGATTLDGGIAADGRVFTLVGTTAANPPTLSIGLRRGGTFSTASLTGAYHFCAFYQGGGTDIAWWSGVATFDGVGGVMASSGTNAGGIVSPPAAAVPFGTYSVAGDGTVSWNSPLPTIVWRGGMLAGGDLVVLSGTTTNNDIQFIFVLIRQGAGLSNATLSGNYHVVAVSSMNAPPPRYSALVGTSTANGTGSWTYNGGTINQDGTLLPSGALPPVAYAVSANGALSVAAGGLQGAVSPGGEFAMWAGGTTGGSTPSFWFLHR